MNAESSVADVSKQVDLMDAIYMVKMAWQSVQTTTIKNCLHKAGMTAMHNTKVKRVEKLKVNPKLICGSSKTFDVASDRS